MRDRHRWAYGLLLGAMLTGCVVGPDATRPDMPLPEQFSPADAWVSTHDAAPPADAEFWKTFDDPLLVRSVEEALAANHDLRIALARFDQANALLRGARFDQIPTITATGSASDARNGAATAPSVPGADRDVESYELGIASEWEFDLFGRIRRNVEAREAEFTASAADLQALQVVIASEVARTYLELRGHQERLRVAQDNAENQRETLRIVTAGLAVGRGTQFDLSRARAQLEGTLARVPAFEAAVSMNMHRLAVLSGRMPDELTAELAPQVPLPLLPERIDAATPGDVLRRRPDVIAAEQRLHAATARIGVAAADLYPRFTLAGLLGTRAIDSSALFEGDSETRLVALGIDWSFLDRGRVHARIAAADAEASGALAAYQKTVIEAVEDTENALVRYARARVEDQHLERAAFDSEQAAEIARVRFEAGAASLLEVLDAERTQLQAQDSFAAARTRSATAAIELYEALAGGWPSRVPLRERASAR